jgi:3-hydroxybutyryl-CoA dehydrogenase
MLATMANIFSIAVLGAGTMGAGIAQVAARAGYRTCLYDPDPSALERAVRHTQSDLERLVKKGKITDEDATGTISRLETITDIEEFTAIDLAIEAAPENLEVKRRLFAKLEHFCGGAILATNTSTLSVSAIAGQVSDPGKVVGMHFFNPAPIMPLVEVIPGDLTRADVLEAAVKVAQRMGKTSVVVKDTPGFIVNRVARAFTGEALRILGENGESRALLETIDASMRGAGFRMGPFELMDLIGLDVNFAASRMVYESFFQDPKYRPSPIQQKMVESGRLGRKSGHGFYSYESEKR